ncbi:MAG: helix-turn-helix domain-containing protein [Anaerobutyricum sp.]|nr:MarR family transcriptional regulator [Eubacterium sp.]MDY6046942.1 helix-turn-helix domain-containing protein [Anaerobutyricum sp.]
MLIHRVLSFCYYHAHKVSEIAEYLGISDSSYLRKQVLANLEKQGYLEKSKLSRAMYFKTNWDMVTVK